MQTIFQVFLSNFKFFFENLQIFLESFHILSVIFFVFFSMVFVLTSIKLTSRFVEIKHPLILNSLFPPFFFYLFDISLVFGVLQEYFFSLPGFFYLIFYFGISYKFIFLKYHIYKDRSYRKKVFRALFKIEKLQFFIIIILIIILVFLFFLEVNFYIKTTNLVFIIIFKILMFYLTFPFLNKETKVFLLLTFVYNILYGVDIYISYISYMRIKNPDFVSYLNLYNNIENIFIYYYSNFYLIIDSILNFISSWFLLRLIRNFYLLIKILH